MLTKYIQAAMKRAQYGILEDKSYYGSIAGFDGVWANEPTLEACREELQEALESFTTTLSRAWPL
jgi:predicted RNase H-like HicB family nuclease